ncbi:hypothetical protein NPX13_g3892 [Xylaria arbuscula]|uniref:Uncharacterized protein n=1 Tax=Xylaria arbuscula TaxID=114810 RepID=A0A9W8NHL4_9PEZI|nr:hypothetical protein NPX13_g3892 [Xylaria arbuscula]
MTTEEHHGAEWDADWLFDELKRYNRRPPWYSESEPDEYGAIDPIFKGDALFCLVYRAARRRARGTTRFKGQADLRQKVEKLNRASSEHKQAVVTKLLDIITPERRHEVQLWKNEKGGRKKKRPADSCDEFVSPPRTPSLETAATRTSQAIDDTPNIPLVHQSPGATDNSFTMQASLLAFGHCYLPITCFEALFGELPVRARVDADETVTPVDLLAAPDDPLRRWLSVFE